MKTFVFPIAVLLVVSCHSHVSAEKTRLESWQFKRGSAELSADASSWNPVHVPHTWNAEDGHDGGEYYRGLGWYQTDLNLDDLSSNERVFLRFQAVGTEAEVFLDGESIGDHLGGYTAFAFEITDKIKGGQTHDLRVRADNAHRLDLAPLSGDFTVFGGMHRPVELIRKQSLCISPLDYASPGVFITQENVSKESADLRVGVLLDNGAIEAKQAEVVYTLTDADGNQVAQRIAKAGVSAGETEEVVKVLKVDNPHLWHGIKDPYLYTVKVELHSDGRVVDEYEKRVGFRFFHVDAKTGFYLNGEHYPLRGVNLHYDREGKGAALSDDDLREDYRLVCELGANAVRLAHYPHATLSYELCDELGMLVWAEIPLVNQVTHHPGFAPNSESQLLEMVRQHNNHCSIFTWSLANELYHKKTDDPMPLLNDLNKLCKQQDPSRPTVLATNQSKVPLCNLTDLLAFNTYPGWYYENVEGMKTALTKYNKLGGHRGVAVSEYGAGGSLIHQDQRLIRVDPGGPWHPEQWQSYLHERQFDAIVNNPACWGSFVWNMFEFSSDGRDEGDRPGVNDKGIMTHDRKVRKDIFYFYQANWIDEPVLYLTSKRHHIRRNPETPVRVYTNLSEVTLTVNGNPISQVEPNDLKIASWKGVTLVEGENHVVITGKHGDKEIIDQATWVYDPKSPRPGPSVAVANRESR